MSGSNVQVLRAARSIQQLAALIRKDLEAGDRGYTDAGHKLLEARQNFLSRSVNKKGEPRKNLSPVEARAFFAWAYREFDRQPNQLRVYMRMALGELNKARAGKRSGKTTASFSWEDRINAEFEFKGFEEEDLDDEAAERTFREERKGQHSELILRMINLGYKALALKLHPDNGGSNEEMQRLNAAVAWVRREFR
jgi:hypothetical protein